MHLGALALDPFKPSLDVADGYDQRGLWHRLAAVHRANPFDVAAATLGEAVWGLHPPFGNEDPQIGAFEPVVTWSVHAHEEALVFVGDLMPVVADTHEGQIAVLVKPIGTGLRAQPGSAPRSRSAPS